MAVIPWSTSRRLSERRLGGVHVDDQVNGGRGALWTDAMEKLRGRFPFRLCITGQGEFIGLFWNTGMDDFSVVQVQALCAKKSHTTANTRRSARPDDFATPFHVINHIPTAQQGNWLGGPDLSCQITLAGASACVRREAPLFADLHLAFLSIPPDKLR